MEFSSTPSTFPIKFPSLLASPRSYVELSLYTTIEKIMDNYDKEKYREMRLDAAETVLGYFGFDRTLYRDKKNILKRKGGWKN